MPLFILFVGILLIVAGINNRLGDLTDLLKEDFRPTTNVAGFHVWILAIVGIGSLGYIKGFRPFANSFLVLIMVVMVLSNKGFIEQFTKAIEGN